MYCKYVKDSTSVIGHLSEKWNLKDKSTPEVKYRYDMGVIYGDIDSGLCLGTFNDSVQVNGERN